MRETVASLLLAVFLMAGVVVPASAQTQVVTACTERVTNGGFEAGVAGWEPTTNGPFALVGPALPHTGALGAILGARNDADDRIEQVITLPAGQTATLRFWWHMITEEPDHPWDTLEVTVKPAGSSESIRLARITDGDIQGQWRETVLSLSAYAGQTVELSFRAETDANQPTEFYLDDVSAQACSTQALSKRLLLPVIAR